MVDKKKERLFSIGGKVKTQEEATAGEKAKTPLIESGLSERQAEAQLNQDRPEAILRKAAEQSLRLQAEEKKIIADKIAETPQTPVQTPSIEEFQAQPKEETRFRKATGELKTPQEVLNPENTLGGAVKATAGITAGAGAIALAAPAVAGLGATAVIPTTSRALLTTAKAGSGGLLSGGLKAVIGAAALLGPNKLIKDAEKSLNEAESGLNALISGVEAGETNIIDAQQQYLLYLQTISDLERTFKIYKKFDIQYYLGDGKDTMTKIETARRMSRTIATQLQNAVQTQAVNKARQETGLA